MQKKADKQVYKIILQKKVSQIQQNTANIQNSIRNNFKITVEKIKPTLHHNKLLIFCFVVLLFVILSNFTKSGIILNDELQRRFLRMQGFKDFASQLLQAYKNQGRIVSAVPSILSQSLNFAHNSKQWIGFIRIISILTNLTLFAIFLKQLFRSLRFSVFCSVVLLASFPITFEHTMPNAYNEYSIGLTFLFCSLILFVFALKKSSRLILFLCMSTLFLSLLFYEAFITITPLYFFITFLNRKKNNFRKVIKKISPIAITDILYLCLYFGSRIKYPSYYPGNTFTFISLKNSFDIILQLVKSSLPGYFFTNKKYNYIFTLFSGEEYSAKNFIHQIVSSMFSWRLLLFAFVFSSTLIILFRWKAKKEPRSAKKQPFLNVVLVGILLTLFLAIPNSLAKMYSGIVNEKDFIALPVSYLMMFTSVFVICFVLWKILERFHKKWTVVLVCLGVTILCMPVQAMNIIFSAEQSRNFDRLVMIEKFFDTQAAFVIKNKTIFSKDFYSTRNTLAIHGDYWTQYSQLKGFNSKIMNEPFPQQGGINCYLQDDRFFVLRVNNIVSILSPQSLDWQGNMHPVKIDDITYSTAFFDQPYIDGEFVRYDFIYHPETNTLQALPPATDPFYYAISNTESNLNSALKISGYHHDGWVSPVSNFRIRTQDSGSIVISGYYPGEITSKLSGIVYVNDIPTAFIIMEQVFELVIPAPANQEISVCIENNFVYEHDLFEDPREFCFILSGLEGR